MIINYIMCCSILKWIAEGTDRMHVLAVIPCSIYGSSGDSVNERQLLEALSRKFDRVIVLSMVPLNTHKKYVKSVPSNIVLINLPYPPYFGYPFMLFYSFVTLLFGYLLDKLQGLNFIYVRGTMLGFGLMLSHKLRAKTTVKFGGFIEDELTLKGITLVLVKKVASTIDKIVLSKCAKIAANNALWVKEILTKRGVSRPLKEYVFLPPGINLSKISRLINKITPNKKEYSYKVGFIGTLVWWQGVDILVRAIRIVQNKINNIELLIIGDGPLRAYIENLAKALDVNLKITGYLPHEKALEVFSTVDILVLPSYKMSSTELNIPIKVIEAWALGIPVIVTPKRVFLDKFRDGIDVIYAEPTPKAIANKIILLLSNTKLKGRLSKNGRLLAKKFDYDIIVDNLVSNISTTHVKVCENTT